jgi:hypothetical protein
LRVARARWPRPALLGAVALACGAGAAVAQSARQSTLRARFTDLFRFGGAECGTDVLFCLVNSSGTSAAEAFSTNANATAAALTRFVQSAITQGIANAPIPSTGSGTTFRLTAAGVPVRNEDESAGPIFGERATTLGMGRLLVGFNLTDLSLERLRDTPVEDIRFNIAQRDLPPGGGVLGDPVIEQTYLAVQTRIGLQARVTNLFLTYGLRAWLDVGVTVPFVQAALSGYSDARIVPGRDSDPAAGFSFGGPPEDPRLLARAVVPRSTAFGLGDLSLRAKARLNDLDAPLGVGVLVDARLPTGSTADFLGAGGVWVRALGVASWRAGSGVVPHLNLGYYRRSGEGVQSAAVVTLGADLRASDRFTVAGELLGQLVLGPNPLRATTITISGSQPILASNIATRRDDVYDASLGAKYTFGRLTALANLIGPLNSGGLRGGLLWTAGFQAAF